MKKILVIVDEYRPDNNANSNCIENIIDQLNSKFNITVFTSKIVEHYEADKKCEEDIKRYPNLYIGLYKKYNDGLLSSSRSLIFRIFNMLFVNLFWADINYYWYISQRKNMLDDVRKGNFDFIVTTSGSFATQQIGRYISRKTNIPWFAYFNDPLPDQNHLFQARKNYGMNIDKESERVFKNAHKIIFNKHLYSCYTQNNKYRQYYDKLYEIDYPLIIPKDIKEIGTKDKFIIVYAGALYKSIRNPENVLPVLTELSKHTDVEVHFLGGGDCSDILKKYDRSYEWFFYHGQLSLSEARNYINQANMLVNIGNTIINQTPSKIFEYISTGKLICNFYFDDRDSSMEYLRGYPNSINIKVNSKCFASLGEEINAFIGKNIKTLHKEEIEKTFMKNTPLYAEQIFKSLFEKQLIR